MTNIEYAHQIVKNFITEHPLAYKSMQQVSHTERDLLSDWHLEGSIWTHTMMVVSTMCQLAEGFSNAKELLLAALLHDVGKVYTREINQEKQKVTFYGHPGLSTFLANSMLNKIDPSLTKAQRIEVLSLINYHQVLFNVTDDMSTKALYKLVDKFNTIKGWFLLTGIRTLRDADSLGRISISSGKLNEDRYDELMDILAYNYLNDTDEPKQNSKQPTAVIMVGLPGSGKSTYSQQKFPDYTLVSRDAQVEHLGNGLSYSEAFKTVDQKEVDARYQQVFATAVQKKENIVIDKTNLTHKSRMRSIQPLKDKGYNITIVVLMPSIVTLYRRNAKRTGKVVPTKVIRHMMTTFEMPFANEGSTSYVFDF